MVYAPLKTILSFAELILAYTAQGASEVLGQIFKFGAGRDSVIGIANCFVIFPAANVTNVFLHNS